MTEKELYNLQNDIYWMVNSQFKQNNIPPILQKMIMEGIYSRFQTLANSYDWELMIEDIAKKNHSGEEAEETEMIVPDYMRQQDENLKVPDCIKESKGQPQETPDGVIYN